MWEEDSEEKRKAPRIKKQLVIQYSFKRGIDQPEVWDESVINDISETGASFNVGKQFRRDEIFVIYLYSPVNPADKIEIKVKVIDSAASSIGIHRTRVEFVGLLEEQKILLRECIAQFLK
ncbi:MAG: PilZ domain-containing protein [Candidatus Omnitrophota bacterium]|nr:PilZ domain-containing protein [Candidatus Omnitrophota bacterium]